MLKSITKVMNDIGTKLERIGSYPAFVLLGMATMLIISGVIVGTQGQFSITNLCFMAGIGLLLSAVVLTIHDRVNPPNSTTSDE